VVQRITNFLHCNDMTTYIVTLIATGREIYRYSADEPVEWTGMEFATHDHTAAQEELPTPVITAPIRITKLAFRNRFTQAEKIAIEIAGLDNPAAPMQQRAMSAALRASQADVASATFIDLSREDTRAGVHTLESVGILAAGRAAVILDTPPTAEEVFNG
jgi:hypothetical protein